jgi:hypothetical protein
MSRIRKIVTIAEDVVTELGAPAAHQTRRVAAAAVVGNPWAGKGVVPDLTTAAAQLAADLAIRLTGTLTTALGGAGQLQAFGKAALVGLDGEIEHGAALIHTPYFGNLLRELAEGTSIVAFSDQQGPAGTVVTVPMWHKTEASTRSHYQSIPVRIPDAPAENEIVVIAAAASGPRPNARIGDRTTDPNVSLALLEAT